VVPIVFLTGKASTSKVSLVLSHDRLIIYLSTLRLITRLKENDPYYIAFQEDFYHTEVSSNDVNYGPHLHINLQDCVALFLPPIAPFVKCALGFSGLISNVLAHGAQIPGY
jgi:hypothetical protein